MGAYYTWADRLVVLLVFVIPIVVYVVLVAVGAWFQDRERKKYVRERRRLEKVVRDYNRAFNDDYDPFER